MFVYRLYWCFYNKPRNKIIFSVTGGRLKRIITIHRPLGADLQPLIFRIPPALFQRSLFYLGPACSPEGREVTLDDEGWAGQSLHSQLFGWRLMCEEVAYIKRLIHVGLPGADKHLLYLTCNESATEPSAFSARGGGPTAKEPGRIQFRIRLYV